MDITTNTFTPKKHNSIKSTSCTKAIIFARVSSKDQEEGQSIPAQIRRLTEYASKKGLTVDQIFQITESSSKKRRKQFDEVINYIKKAKQPIALVTDTIDRLQRSFRETPMLDDMRKEGKIEMHFLREGLILSKTSNSADLTRWDMGVIFASSYIRQMRDNVMRSQSQCMQNGQWITKAPYGYKNVAVADSANQRTIIVNHEQAPWVEKIFELYAQGGNSFQTVADKMREAGFSKTSRGKSISDRTIELILKNPFYVGKMLVEEEWIRHQYPALIPEWLFHKVQAIIKNHHKTPVQYAGKPILFRGFIRCGRCGGTVCGDIKKQKYVYYSCHNAKRICVKKWIKEEVLLATILPYFDAIQLTDEQVDDIVEHLQGCEAEEQSSLRQLEQQTRQRLGVIQERLSKLIDMRIDGTIDSTAYQMKLDEYNKEKQELSERLNSYKGIDKADLIVAKEVLELAQEAKDIFLSSKLEEKQQLLGFFFSNFTLNDEKLDLELREPFRVMQKMQDQHVWRG
jgi:site-specific DNA recombinase